MKPSVTVALILLAAGILPAVAQLQLLPDQAVQSVFAGDARQISVIWQNTGDDTIVVDLHAHILQATSATTAPWNDVPWKKLQVLPGQTILESAQLDFPTVRAETKFLIQWVSDSNTIHGVTAILVYPTNLLAELKSLVGDSSLGLYDPENQLKPLLKSVNIRCEDLENSSLGYFDGRLAIIGPFQNRSQMPANLPQHIATAAKKGVAIVWFTPPTPATNKLVPSFYSVPENTNCVIVAQSGLISGIAESPQAQRDLVSLCKLALAPQPPVLPGLTANP